MNSKPALYTVCIYEDSAMVVGVVVVGTRPVYVHKLKADRQSTRSITAGMYQRQWRGDTGHGQQSFTVNTPDTSSFTPSLKTGWLTVQKYILYTQYTSNSHIDPLCRLGMLSKCSADVILLIM